jgi:hypothetical protein
VAVGEGKNNAVLDEIAAKVSEMDVNEGDPNRQKCMDTVVKLKSQRTNSTSERGGDHFGV